MRDISFMDSLFNLARVFTGGCYPPAPKTRSTQMVLSVSGQLFLFPALYLALIICYTSHVKKQPELNNLTPCEDIEALFFSACEQEEDIESVLFENLTLEGGSYPGLTFRQCRFVGCHLTGCTLERAAFIDCVLEHCDFSNTQMPKGTLQRTWLSDCKLLGVTLAESFLLDAVFEVCAVRYGNFSTSKMRHVHFLTCDLTNAAVSGCHLSSIAFDRCLLTHAELFQTAFSGMDLSNCDISGIAISGGELRGAKVNMEQAAMLGQLLAGVMIAENLPQA